jgi:hypothetical protein
MKTKQTRKLKNATIKRRRHRYQQRGGEIYIQTQRIQNDRYKIITAETDDDTGILLHLYIGNAKAIFPVSQGCGRESISGPRHGSYLFHGKGMLYSLYPDNVFLIYEGMFKNNERSGKGKQTFFRSKGPIDHGIQTLNDLEGMTVEQVNELMNLLSSNNDILEVYDGTWQNDMKHGKGKLLMNSDKGLYNGDFQNGMMHGNGKILYQTGPIVSYDGGWYAGQMHGLGEIVYRDGHTSRSEYNHGNLIRHLPIGSVFGRNFFSSVTPHVFGSL